MPGFVPPGGDSGSGSSSGDSDSGATTFDALTDTPRRKVAGQYPRVNAAGSALGYHDTDGDVHALRELADENRATLAELGPITETRGDFADATDADLAALWGAYVSRAGGLSDASIALSGTIASPGATAIFLRTPRGVSPNQARVEIDRTAGTTSAIPNYADSIALASEAWTRFAAPSDARAHADYWRADGGGSPVGVIAASGGTWKLQLAPLTRSVAAAGQAIDIYGWRDGTAQSSLPADAADRTTRVAYVGRGLVPMSFASALGRYLHFLVPLAYELDLISIDGDNRVASFTTTTDLTRRLYHSAQLTADAGDVDVLLRAVEASP